MSTHNRLRKSKVALANWRCWTRLQHPVEGILHNPAKKMQIQRFLLPDGSRQKLTNADARRCGSRQDRSVARTDPRARVGPCRAAYRSAAGPNAAFPNNKSLRTHTRPKAKRLLQPAASNRVAHRRERPCDPSSVGRLARDRWVLVLVWVKAALGPAALR